MQKNNRYLATVKEFQRHINQFSDIILANIGATLNARINDKLQIFHPEF